MLCQFLGATGTVTGSKTLIQTKTGRLLVDCGLFQGYKQLRLRNWADFPVRPDSIDAVLLTHAHLDHSGYLPLLVKNGFRGKIYCSEATFELCRILLPDSGHLLEEEANYNNRHGTSKHSPALPLYSEADAVRALRYFNPVKFHHDVEPIDGVTVRFERAGHILGAGLVVLQAEGKKIVFSGDLGRPNDEIMPPPTIVEDADYLLVESTYGDRVHDPADAEAKIGHIIAETAARGGVTIIPSFAVGRAQSLLYTIHKLKESGRIPKLLPVYLNSPMAVDATHIYRKHKQDHLLTPAQCEAMCHAARLVNSVEESIALNEQRVPMVIIAASGMATGGRVLHHLRAFAPDPRNTILFAGFQAGGTRGAAMLNGVDSIKIYGDYVPLRAQVEQIENLSAHADREEILAWLGHFKKPPKMTYVVHGEMAAADSLRRTIEERLHWNVTLPEYLQREELA